MSTPRLFLSALVHTSSLDTAIEMPSKSGVSLCRKPDCSHCAVSPEASVAHSDCFEFIAQCCKLDDYLDYLWVVTAWRTPWRQAPHFRLKEPVIKPDWSVLDKLGISLRSLPLEILQMIHKKYSTTSLVWRLNAASNLSRQLPTTLSADLLSIPLHAVVAWKRGGQPITEQIVNQIAPVIRLTIDSWGIQEVERLPGNPECRGRRTDGLVFIILDQKSLKGITACFKVKAHNS